MKKIIIASAITAIGMSLAACKVEGESSTRAQGEKEQEAIMERATNRVPTYIPRNFLTRETVNKWMKRMDVPDKTFYVYLLGDNGNQLGYYVAQTRPINECTLLTPPDRENVYSAGSTGLTTSVTAAPSLDGVYGKGGCESYFFFEASTDAYIETHGMDFFVADQPLNLDAEPITVSSQ